ncbi:MAG: sensor histidine kinase, partial [Bacteroidetes bacterium]|nr:sensor histidine kinase [Bacteroidota bacterium]
LASYLQNVREQERTNIAREIHDELGQQLTGLKMDISWLSKKTSLTEEQRKEKIKGILELIDIAINTIRRISAELRPSILDDLGLAEAMQWQTQEFEKRSGIKSYFDFPDNEINLPSAISTSLFRIYQESLTNVARHSEASEVKAYLNVTDSMVTLRIMDNGKGFDSAILKGKKTLGLLGMKERTLIIGGNYQILTKDGGGTEVVVSVPFDKPL